MTDGNNHRNNSTVMRSCFEASFSSLFDNGDIEPRISSLVLPVFQVANQWGPKQVAKLVRDVDSARRSGDLNFFGGCLVLVERERRSHRCCSLVDRNPNYYIIDGKQRIKTITMIVSVCRYYDPENESIYTDWLARDIPFGIRYRLWLDKDINQIDNGRIFEDFILTPGGIGSLFDEDQDIAYSQYVAELRKNAICIMKLLQELGKENSLEFARYMVQRCKFIAIIVPNIELALKVSCSFNLSSGIPSPALEYYRARLYERLIRNMNGWHAQLALRDWNQIEVNLGGAESMQQFLIHFCCVQLYSGR
ncbi:hypothetical protein BKA69DRAFT_713855 [Paraphysoderma sedebokerense]|nr:hypothetical protein BKA69DRAFT_713855 [Paraphysoderma sedebokerense]